MKELIKFVLKALNREVDDDFDSLRQEAGIEEMLQNLNELCWTYYDVGGRTQRLLSLFTEAEVFVDDDNEDERSFWDAETLAAEVQQTIQEILDIFDPPRPAADWKGLESQLQALSREKEQQEILAELELKALATPAAPTAISMPSTVKDDILLELELKAMGNEKDEADKWLKEMRLSPKAEDIGVCPV